MNASKTCAECDQAVYPLELVSAGQFVYHKWCFRCAHCNRTLSTSNYAVAPSGIPYCKPHFTSTLKLRGGFEEFAVSYAQPPADVKASPVVQSSRSADSNQIVRWSTKPRELQPINRSSENLPAAVVAGRKVRSSGSTSSSSASSDSDDDGVVGNSTGGVSRVKAMFEAMR